MEIGKDEIKKILDDNIKMLLELKIWRVNDLALENDPKEKESIQQNLSELDELINFTREELTKVKD